METNDTSPASPPKRTFPVPGTNLYKILYDPEYKKTFHARLKQSNRFVAVFYRMGLLPLLGVSRQVMLLTTQGRKTHAMRSTPIGYFRIDGQVYVFSAWGKATHWYQNILACPDEVYMQIGFQRRRAIAQEVSDPQELQRLLEHFVAQDPQGARVLFGWDPAQDRAETADFAPMIEKVLVVRFATD